MLGHKSGELGRQNTNLARDIVLRLYCKGYDMNLLGSKCGGKYALHKDTDWLDII